MSQSKEEITQWVSTILNAETKSQKSLEYLNSILGPVKAQPNNYIRELDDSPDQLELAEYNQEIKGVFLHEIVFKINEKIFIEKINIYEKICPGSSILKLEAFDSLNEKWFLLWKTDRPLDSSKPKIFSPAIFSTPFKTDTIKFTVCGSLYLIDGIEIKGNKYGIEDDAINNEEINSLSEDLRYLIGNELFADVYFEVEGRIIATHKNILCCRSEYFEKLIDSHFKIYDSNIDPAKKPIYIKDIEYDVFMQILNYIYTGLLNYENNHLASALLIKVVKMAIKFDLEELIQLCLFDISEMIDENSVIRIFKEAFDEPRSLCIILDYCYQVIIENFAIISRSEDFCSLEQNLMHHVIKNVLPQLKEIKTCTENGQFEQFNQDFFSKSNQLVLNNGSEN